MVPDTRQALVEALGESTVDPVVVAHEVGASAARLGYPLAEVLDELERVYAAERGQEPEYRVVKAAVAAWSDASMVQVCDVSCEDPLTTLATLPHLRSRIEEVYRAAASGGKAVGEEYALWVVELRSRAELGGPLEDPLAKLRTAEALRLVLDGDETFAEVAPLRIAGLVRRIRFDRIRTLREALAAHDVDVEHLWSERLPGSVTAVAWLLSELAR